MLRVVRHLLGWRRLVASERHHPRISLTEGAARRARHRHRSLLMDRPLVPRLVAGCAAKGRAITDPHSVREADEFDLGFPAAALDAVDAAGDLLRGHVVHAA